MPKYLPPDHDSYLTLGGLGTKIGIVFTSILLATLMLVGYTIQGLSKALVISQSIETMQEKGNRLVNNLDDIIEQMALLTVSVAGGAIPLIKASQQDNGDALNQYIYQMYDHLDDKRINGFGIYPDNHQFKTPIDIGLYWYRPQLDKPYTLYTDVPKNYNVTSEFWYVPSKVLYQQTGYQDCVWTESYIEPLNRTAMVTCASPVVNNNKLLGITQVDISLSDIDSLLQAWQKDFNGYMFLVDNNNRILSFPSLTAEQRKKLIIKNEGVKNYNGYHYDIANLTLNDLVTNYPQFASLQQTINEINQTLIQKARATLNHNNRKQDIFDNMTTQIVKQSQGIIKTDEAERLVAFTFDNRNHNSAYHLSNKNTDFLQKQLAFQHDEFLHRSTNVMMFMVPNTHWKLIIAQSQDQTNKTANNLSNTLMAYLVPAILLGVSLILIFVRRMVTQRLKQTSQQLYKIQAKISQQNYHLLNQLTLPTAGDDEISYLNASINTLLKHIQDNEGVLASLNMALEQKVEDRTKDLKNALKELKSSQVQLIRAEKMSTLGQMVAGVAHEVNTPLSYIQNNLELIGVLMHHYDTLTIKLDQFTQLLANKDTSEPNIYQQLEEILPLIANLNPVEIQAELRQMIQDSLFGVEQISDLVSTLRNFSRIDESKIKQVDITDCIQTCLTMLKNNLKTVTLFTDFNTTLPIICSPSQINQVIINVLSNACHAVMRQKSLIDAHAQTPFIPKIGILTLSNEEWLCIEITDNGHGMDSHTLEHLFEPFFTTKKTGEGTGLGMAISQQIISQHGGRIDVMSQPNQGTTFTLSLPIHSPLVLLRDLSRQ